MSLPPATAPVRETARVVVVDGEQLLLLQMQGPDEHDLIWITPGGQVEDGEEPEQAASREVHEETGLLIDPAALGRPVAVSEGRFRWQGVDVAARDVFYVYEHPRFEPDVRGLTGQEREHYRQARWWSLPELSATTETVVPAGLDRLVVRVRELGPPPTPLVIPWTAG